MPVSKTRIISLLCLLAALLLSGCSAIRLAYNNAPQLSWWWLDGYVDFAGDQSGPARQAVDRWFDWHRPSQLPAYALLLVKAQGQITQDITAEEACRWNGRARALLEPALQRAAAEFAPLVTGLGEAQFKHLQERYRERNAEMRDEFLSPEPATRRRETMRRTVERAERLYGALEEPQLQIIRTGLASSPFNPELWLLERERRQQEALRVLRQIQADNPSAEQSVAALRALAFGSERSPDAAYRSYQLKLTEYNCALAARVHNSTSTAQRTVARTKLKGWEEDLRALVRQSNGRQ